MATMKQKWTTPECYGGLLLISGEYAQTMYHTCHAFQTHAYEWIEAADRIGFQEDGDFYHHAVYPEINPSR